MSALTTQSDLLRRAVEYVAETRAESPDKALAVVLDEAAMRFNLSPLDAEALSRLFTHGADGAEPTA